MYGRGSFILFILLVNIFLSCRKDEVRSDTSIAYDIILVMGQSNTHYGKGLDSILDVSAENIFQLGRFENDYNVIQAKEPLDHHTKKENRIGFALTFAKLYAEVYLEDGREVLIIPCGKSGSGFHNNKWNKGDTLYEDAIDRTNYILKQFPKSELKVVLWHQGEDDVNKENYQTNLDSFIVNLRSDLKNDSVLFILGGMVPYWVDQLDARKLVQDIISATPNRIAATAYANPYLPIAIEADTNDPDFIHYTAAGQREMGARYFLEYVKLRD